MQFSVGKQRKFKGLWKLEQIPWNISVLQGQPSKECQIKKKIVDSVDEFIKEQGQSEQKMQAFKNVLLQKIQTSKSRLQTMTLQQLRQLLPFLLTATILPIQFQQILFLLRSGVNVHFQNIRQYLNQMKKIDKQYFIEEANAAIQDSYQNGSVFVYQAKILFAGILQDGGQSEQWISLNNTLRKGKAFGQFTFNIEHVEKCCIKIFQNGVLYYYSYVMPMLRMFINSGNLNLLIMQDGNWFQIPPVSFTRQYVVNLVSKMQTIRNSNVISAFNSFMGNQNKLTKKDFRDQYIQF